MRRGVSYTITKCCWIYIPVLTCIPGAPGSTPESKIAMTTPRPSYSGYLVRNWVTPVSFLGSRPQIGKLQSMTPAIFQMPPWLSEKPHSGCFLCTVPRLYISIKKRDLRLRALRTRQILRLGYRRSVTSSRNHFRYMFERKAFRWQHPRTSLSHYVNNYVPRDRYIHGWQA